MKTSILPFRRRKPPPFEALLEPHLDWLFRLAYRLTQQRADAEDLVQDLLIRLFPRHEELAAVEQLRPWLGRALYNAFVDRVRHSARRPDMHGEALDDLPGLTNEETGPEQDMEQLLLQRRLLALLAELPGDQRAVVALHDMEGYSLPELEHILQIPVGTLKSRLHRARQRLRTALAMEPSAHGERVKG